MKMTGTGGTVNLAADLTAEEGSRTGTITIAEADENSKIDVNLEEPHLRRPDGGRGEVAHGGGC